LNHARVWSSYRKRKKRTCCSFSTTGIERLRALSISVSLTGALRCAVLCFSLVAGVVACASFLSLHAGALFVYSK
jgi:hypothetical protein